MPGYKDLHEWLNVLDRNKLLVRVTRPIIKESELAPLVRLQFRGLLEDQRRGFVFENVVDSKGRKYEAKVATSVYASSMLMYALGLNCEPTRDAIAATWNNAQASPIEPILVNKGAVQEIVCQGEELSKDGKGLESLPVPVEAPGFSGQIRTSTHIITKDPKTGIRNMGNYSGHIIGKTTVLWEILHVNHGWLHRQAWKELGKKSMPAAIVVGGPPSFFYVAGAKLPYNVDELAVAGAFAGEPVEMVKCKTIDLEVPANAEIVVEGLVSTEEVMPGNAFAEYTGYMATEVEYRPVFHVTAVTSRASPYFVHIMSQFPPSESSKIRQISSENVYLKFLRDDCKIPGILDVVWNEISQAQWCVIKVKKINNAQPWQALYCAAGFEPLYGKYFITVDEDIDPRDSDAVTWALGWRVQPVRDMKTISGRFPGLDVSAYKCDASEEEKRYPGGVGSSALLIDATIKHPYPPLSLPSSEHMNNALKIWKELGLSELNLRQPWFGYSLGFWPEHYKKDAELVTRGEHYQVGKRLSEGAKSG